MLRIRRCKSEQGGGICVARVYIDQGESFEGALKRFKKAVQEDRILSEVRRRRFYEKPSQLRKREKAAKRRKSRRTTMKDLQRKY